MKEPKAQSKLSKLFMATQQQVQGRVKCEFTPPGSQDPCPISAHEYPMSYEPERKSCCPWDCHQWRVVWHRGFLHSSESMPWSKERLVPLDPSSHHLGLRMERAESIQQQLLPQHSTRSVRLSWCLLDFLYLYMVSFLAFLAVLLRHFSFSDMSIVLCIHPGDGDIPSEVLHRGLWVVQCPCWMNFTPSTSHPAPLTCWALPQEPYWGRPVSSWNLAVQSPVITSQLVATGEILLMWLYTHTRTCAL